PLRPVRSVLRCSWAPSGAPKTPTPCATACAPPVSVPSSNRCGPTRARSTVCGSARWPTVAMPNSCARRWRPRSAFPAWCVRIR
ncbi:hypothetical protein XPN_0690, partial [Xanthomonas arboricola pv. pruni MAFF 301427]